MSSNEVLSGQGIEQPPEPLDIDNSSFIEVSYIDQKFLKSQDDRLFYEAGRINPITFPGEVSDPQRIAGLDRLKRINSAVGPSSEKIQGSTGYELAVDAGLSLVDRMAELGHPDLVVAVSGIVEQIRQRRTENFAEQISTLNELVNQEPQTLWVKLMDYTFEKTSTMLAKLKGFYLKQTDSGVDPYVIVEDLQGNVGTIPDGFMVFGAYIELKSRDKDQVED